VARLPPEIFNQVMSARLANQVMLGSVTTVSRWRGTIPVPIWKTIDIGICKSANAYRKALKQVGRRVCSWANDTLSAISYSRDGTQLDLTVVSPKELGFDKGIRRYLRSASSNCVLPRLVPRYGPPTTISRGANGSRSQ
jgi:hypothetical protein